jgi:hypothetical protein
MKKLIAILAAAGVLAAVAASPAQALTQTDYEVIVEGEANYAHSLLRPAIEGQWTRQEQASFKWRTRFPLVSFIGKGLAAVVARPTTTVEALKAISHESIPKPSGPMTADCSGDLLATPADGAWFGGSIVPDLDPSTEDVAIRLIGDVSVILPTCSGTLRDTDWVIVHRAEEELGMGPFDANFELPHEAIDMDRIIQLLEGNEAGARCPGYEQGFTVSCALTWKATVTFVRTAQSELGPRAPELDDSVFVPLPPNAPAHVDDEDLVIPLPTGRLDADAKQAKLTVTCSVTCSGTVAAYLPGRGTGASVTRPLAKARFTGAAGRATTVTLRFPPRPRQLIKNAGGVRVAVHAVAPSRAGEVQRAVVIHLPARSGKS